VRATTVDKGTRRRRKGETLSLANRRAGDRERIWGPPQGSATRIWRESLGDQRRGERPAADGQPQVRATTRLEEKKDRGGGTRGAESSAHAAEEEGEERAKKKLLLRGKTVRAIVEHALIEK